MSRYKYYIGFIALLFAGLAALFVVSLGYYPIILVNSHLISEHAFVFEYKAAALYYQNLMNTYLKNATSVPMDDLQLMVVNHLIDKNLISDGAKKEVGADLNTLVSNKIDKYADDAELATAVQKLYGMSTDEFRSEVLVPQAEQEILAGRLYIRGQKIDDWILDARKSAHVVVLSGNFTWDGEKIVLRQ